MKFKYSEYIGPNSTKIFRPTVPIIFKNKSKFIQTEAIIDSGADFTILPIELAGILELKLDGRKKTTFHGAGSNPFTVYPSPVKIEHILRQEKFRPIKWKTNIFFAESQPGILLGHKGFLENFRVTLDGKRKEIEINQR
ncbi:MAG: hypothetical protein GWP15_03175 [Nitrospirae bacterium]|nr:hypothetical protein [Nitrospirota bacterium]